MVRVALCTLFTLVALANRGAAVEFVVKVPDKTPADAHVYIAGSHELLGNWKADRVELTRAEDGTFRANIDLKPGESVEYKFTLGSWENVEKNADGSERENRTATIDEKTTRIEATIERWAAAEAAPSSTVVGTLKLHSIESKLLGKQRTIRVWLPADYDADPSTRYPVLYMHDGQNLFDRKTSAFGHEWEIDEALTKLEADGKVKPMIVVGIDNGGADRISEYTFVADPGRGGGNGERYAKFLLDEVRPLINQTYQTQVGRENTYIGGSSLGGLVSIEIAKRYPNVFGVVMAMSPSLWWSNRAIFHDLERDSSGLADTRVWIDMGTREGDGAESAASIDAARQLDAILVKNKIDHHLMIADGAEHNESAWAARFSAAIEYLGGTK